MLACPAGDCDIFHEVAHVVTAPRLLSTGNPTPTGSAYLNFTQPQERQRNTPLDGRFAHASRLPILLHDLASICLAIKQFV